MRFAARVDEAEPAPAERERVERILLEAADPDYWFAASRDGNREAHYRGAPLPHSLLEGFQAPDMVSVMYFTVCRCCVHAGTYTATVLCREHQCVLHALLVLSSGIATLNINLMVAQHPCAQLCEVLGDNIPLMSCI